MWILYIQLVWSCSHVLSQRQRQVFSFKLSNFFNLLVSTWTVPAKLYSPVALQKHYNLSKPCGLSEDKCGNKDTKVGLLSTVPCAIFCCVWCGASIWSCLPVDVTEDNPALRIPQEEVGKPLSVYKHCVTADSSRLNSKHVKIRNLKLLVLDT